MLAVRTLLSMTEEFRKTATSNFGDFLFAYETLLCLLLNLLLATKNMNGNGNGKGQERLLEALA